MQFAQTADEITSITDDALAAADQLLELITSATERTWASTLAPLDEISDVLERAVGQGAFMAYVHDDPEVREAGHAAEQRIQQWGVELMFREDLHAAVSAYATTDEAASLIGERARLLEFVQRDLRRAGHELDAPARAELKELSQRLVELGVSFQRNVTEHEDALIVTRADLAGLPDAYIESLAPGPDEGTFKITMAYPDVVPFMDNAQRRDLRRDLDRRFNSRAVDLNRPLLDEGIRLRARIAELFGQPSWSHHQLELKMAGAPEAVEELYAGLLPPLTAAAAEDVARMQQLLAEDIGDEGAVIERYDWRYYHTKVEREQHGVDQQLISEHFALEAVLDGMFTLTGDVFGLDYEQIDVPVWHEDVRSFEVRDRADGRTIARFHMDLFPREGTFGHAAAFTLIPGRLLPDGSYQRPESAIVANFTKPSGGRPSLLQHGEVETLFHEFGHILHQVLTTTELVRFSGTSVQRDFVEAPSQIMQHWTWLPEVLATFARHHETGEALPAELIEGLVAARNLDVSVHMLRQIQYGWFDLQVHGAKATTLDMDAVARAATELTLMPHPDDTFWPAAFAHIFGGYDAGYYGYIWAEVIGDDMFRRFQEEGVTSPSVGADYRREILEAGGRRDAGELVRSFLGREPDNTAFLRKLGIS